MAESPGLDGPLSPDDELRGRVVDHLSVLYPDADLSALADRAIGTIGIDPGVMATPLDPLDLWDESDVVAITYGDTIGDGHRRPLDALTEFLDRRLAQVVSTIHVLALCPYSSDDGFSIIDHRKIDPSIGTWADLSRIGATHALMADLVLNHASAESDWFHQFLEDIEPGRSYFKTATAADDLTTVTRPRTHPLLREVATPRGTRRVWCTFSHDQIDLDFANPNVLIEFLSIIDEFLRRGVRWLRLDAIAYLWKVPGTASIHAPQTHEIVRLLRTLVERREPRALLITETNVPADENVAYFGDGDEAHVIYNFSLAPLVVHALLTGRSGPLTRWMSDTAPTPPGTTSLNFIASHDGLGLRPAESLLTDADIEGLADAARQNGGAVSDYGTARGPRPYELNVALLDLLTRPTSDEPTSGKQGPPVDGFRIERFVCAHTIMLALAGMPAFYLHSLLGSPNDLDRLAATGRARSINRGRLELNEIDAALDDPTSERARIFGELTRRIAIRARQPAFHPNAEQHPLSLGSGVFGLCRWSIDRAQQVYAINNLTAEPQSVPWSALTTDTAGDDGTGTANSQWFDLLIDEPAAVDLHLAPYQSCWLCPGPPIPDSPRSA